MVLIETEGINSETGDSWWPAKITAVTWDEHINVQYASGEQETVQSDHALLKGPLELL